MKNDENNIESNESYNEKQDEKYYFLSYIKDNNNIYIQYIVLLNKKY